MHSERILSNLAEITKQNNILTKYTKPIQASPITNSISLSKNVFYYMGGGGGETEESGSQNLP